jgi:hypothetical protein
MWNSIVAIGPLLLIPALIAPLAGCGGPDADTADVSAVDAPRWSPGEEWRLSKTPLVTIGAVDGPEAIGTVGRIVDQSGVALLSDGRIAIADGQANEIRIYDASGARLASTGRTGDGPGEFQGLRGIATFGGDSLLAWDSRGGFYIGRLSVFTGTGVFVRTLPTQRLRMRDVLGLGEDGTMLVEPQESAPPGWEEPTLGEYREPRLYQRLSSSGDSLGTFGPVPGPERAAITATQRSLVYYGRDTYVAMGRRFIYSGDSGSFEIAVHDPETGAVLRHIRRPYEPIAVTPEEHAARVDVIRRANARLDSVTARSSPELVQRLRERRPDPGDIPARDTQTVFTRIVEDPDENVWVRHTVSAPDSIQTWSVFDREGSWLGEIGLPVGMSVRAIGTEVLAVVVRDDLGVEYVHIYRLLKP